jgi:hypothetical protein
MTIIETNTRHHHHHRCDQRVPIECEDIPRQVDNSKNDILMENLSLNNWIQ